jgi:hypothetical protein
MLACTSAGRGKLIARVSRLWRWEFWPSWLFYLPVLPWLAYLSLRYGRVLTWTAANPGIPHGGVVGESKHAILAIAALLSLLWVAGATGPTSKADEPNGAVQKALAQQLLDLPPGLPLRNPGKATRAYSPIALTLPTFGDLRFKRTRSDAHRTGKV